MENTLNAHLNRSLIEKVDKFVEQQDLKVYTSRKHFIETAIAEKLESLTNKEQE